MMLCCLSGGSELICAGVRAMTCRTRPGSSPAATPGAIAEGGGPIGGGAGKLGGGGGKLPGGGMDLGSRAAARGSAGAALARGSAGMAAIAAVGGGWRATGGGGMDGGADRGSTGGGAMGTALDIDEPGTGVLTMSSSLMQYSIASGSCGCDVSSFRASSGFVSAISLSLATTSYISPLFMLLSADATALVPPEALDAPPPAAALPCSSLAPPLAPWWLSFWLRSIPSALASVSRWLLFEKLTRSLRPFIS
mmetsp:Transcript_28368/g.63579  ORF Transcript_28368/g.63579 Transcript_28368/m.63579 type:complete len:251 (+) Transcript_28368:81-833(+)